MPSIPYNDDVDMSMEGDINDRISDIEVDDNSTHNPSPSIDPIPVDDTTERPIDQWIKDTTDTGGDPGTEYNDTPPTEKDPLPPPVYKTVIRKTREIIHDYSQSYLRQLYDGGAKFYVVYKDGTENEVEYTEIYDPHQINTSTYVNEAQAIAEATEQHFWHDDNGSHVTDVEQDDWKTAANANFNDLSDSKPYHNILMNSLGILLRRALNSLVSISKSAITFYDGLGNNLANIRASFGSAGATFRENGKTKATITTQGFAVYDNDGSVSGNNETLGSRLAFIGVDESGKPYTRIGKSSKGYIDIGVNSDDNGYIDFLNNGIIITHIGYGLTNAQSDSLSSSYYQFGIGDGYDFSDIPNWSSSVEYEAGDIVKYRYTGAWLDTRQFIAIYLCTVHCKNKLPNDTPGHWSLIYKEVETEYNTVHIKHGSESCSVGQSLATGGYSFSSGYHNGAFGYCSEAFGWGTLALESGSHSEGYFTRASSEKSHAEGNRTMATGYAAHAEGSMTNATGYCSHTEGNDTLASGTCSHAEGIYTASSYVASHAEGVMTTASGQGSHTEGICSTANGRGTSACGIATQTHDKYGQFVCGIANKVISNAMFCVGNGVIDNIANTVSSIINSNTKPDTGINPSIRRNAFTVLDDGNAYIGGSASSNGTQVTSDARVKILIDELSPETSTEFIKQLKPKHYYKENVEEYGFYAQEVEEISEFGDVLVTKDNSGLYDLPDYRLLNYQGMIAPIVSVEQNLISRIEELERRNEILENQNAELLRRLEAIESKLN